MKPYHYTECGLDNIYLAKEIYELVNKIADLEAEIDFDNQKVHKIIFEEKSHQWRLVA